ncbi:hypothetical protein [Brevibacillus massiliensis]|nr:hypothetical protein [Brevibacillus massiliensis]
MISEKQFINNFNFFWSSLLPTSSLLIKKINEELYIREYDYLQSSIVGRRRSLLSYISFQLFIKASEKMIELDHFPFDEYKIIEEKYIKQFSELEEDDPEITDPLIIHEYNEALVLANRLFSYFSKVQNGSLVINPSFRGCGFINNCFGDVLVDDTLFEIKMVNRNFRVHDCKQLLTYCALNYASNEYTIKRIALFNPRNGKITTFNIDEFCLMMSGKSSTVLLGEIIEFISGGGISR